MDRACGADGSGEVAGEAGIWLGRQKAQVGRASSQPCQYDEDAPQGHEPPDERQRLVAARRESAGVVEVDQQETARRITGGPAGWGARLTLSSLCPRPGILRTALGAPPEQIQFAGGLTPNFFGAAR